MECPKCKRPKVGVIETRPLAYHNGIRRRRQCKGCGHIFPTVELERDLVNLKGEGTIE